MNATLETWINNNLDRQVKIGAKMEQARTTFDRMRLLLCNLTLSLSLEYRFVKCYENSVNYFVWL